MNLAWMKALVLPAALLALAELAMRDYNGASLALAAPSAVAASFWIILWDGSLLWATYETLACAVSGLAIGGLVGLVMALLFGMVPATDRLFEVPVEAIRPIPSIAVLPIGLLIFGFGFSLEIAIVAFACMWPVMITTRAALLGIEPRLNEVARVMRLSVGARVFKIVLPAALPGIFLSFRLATGVSLVVAVTVELTANPIGLGHGMFVAQQGLKPAEMLAYLFWIGLVGWSLNFVLLQLQKALLWSRTRGSQTA